MINLNTTKVYSDVLPFFDKSSETLQKTYDLGITLKKIVNVNDILTEINNIKLKVNIISKKINENVKKTEKIEQQNRKSITKIDTNVFSTEYSNTSNKELVLSKAINDKSSISNIVTVAKPIVETAIRTIGDATGELAKVIGEAIIKAMEDINKQNIKGNSFTENLTDKQYNIMASLSGKFSSNPESFKEYLGKDISEYSSKFESLKGYKVHDVVMGEDGFSVMVLVDDAGNYTMVYPCTKMTLEDVLYDLYPFLVEIGVYDMTISAMDDASTLALLELIAPKLGEEIEIDWNTLKGMNLLEYAKYIYESQQAQSKEISLKYFDNATSEDVSLNFFGFSKGGGMAERAYLTCAEKVSSDALGEIALYNPYHDNLTEEEVAILKESGHFKLYRQQGDFVSMIHNEDDFDDMTTFIKCDWKELINEGSWDIIGLISGTTHIPSNSRGIAYDEDGKAISVDGVSYEEFSKYVFGVPDAKQLLGMIVETIDYTHFDSLLLLFDFAFELGYDTTAIFLDIDWTNIESVIYSLTKIICEILLDTTEFTVTFVIERLLDLFNLLADIIGTYGEIIMNAIIEVFGEDSEIVQFLYDPDKFIDEGWENIEQQVEKYGELITEFPELAAAIEKAIKEYNENTATIPDVIRCTGTGMGYTFDRTYTKEEFKQQFENADPGWDRYFHLGDSDKDDYVGYMYVKNVEGKGFHRIYIYDYDQCDLVKEIFPNYKDNFVYVPCV